MLKAVIFFALLLCNFVPVQGQAETRGPQGEKPVSFGMVGMRLSDRSEIIQRKLKAAIVMHTHSDFTQAVVAGAKQEFRSLNIEAVYVSDANFDALLQAKKIAEALTYDIDILLTLVIDPKSGALALREAVDRDVKIALLSNLPNGFVHKKDYAAIVTDDLFGMGLLQAEMIGEALLGQGHVVWMYHDADYYVTNQRDLAVKNNLLELFPKIKITESGIVNPADSYQRMKELLQSQLNIQAVYVPWDTMAEGVITALKEGNHTDVKVFTMDLGHQVSLEMAKNGAVEGIVADLPFSIGRALALLAAQSVIDIPTPPFVVVPAVKVNRTNLEQMWLRAYQTPAPPEVIKTLREHNP